MFRTADPILNPVRAWAAVVQRVRSYTSSNNDTTVCTFQNQDGTMTSIAADHVRSQLRAIVDVIGVDILGFTSDEVGFHSLRSGGAMAMFLSGTSTIVIMRIGRWYSEAFLEYIREQVEEFTAGVAQKMLRFEDFNNLRSHTGTTEKRHIQMTVRMAPY